MDKLVQNKIIDPMSSKSTNTDNTKIQNVAKLLYNNLIKTGKKKREVYIKRLNTKLFNNTLRKEGNLLIFDDLLRIIKYIANPRQSNVNESLDLFLISLNKDKEIVLQQAIQVANEMFIMF